MSIRIMPGTTPRNGMPPSGGYRYNGTGEDTLTPPDYAALLDEIEQQEIEREHAIARWKSAAAHGRVPLQPCGTLAAYQRHMRRKEQPCEECREASKQAQRKRKGALAS